jgi:hypothetical protein
MLFDLELGATNPDAVVVIGGESGSGKTLRMITTNPASSNLVVYIRLCASELLEHDGDKKRTYEEIVRLDRAAHANPTSAVRDPASLTRDAASTLRDEAFGRLVAAAVRNAIGNVSPVLYRSTTSTVDAIGPHCIVAEGVGEHDIAGCQPDDDVRRSDTRLHRIRRSIMLFDAAWHDVVRCDVDLATAQAPLPFGDVAAPYPTGSRLLGLQQQRSEA